MIVTSSDSAALLLDSRSVFQEVRLRLVGIYINLTSRAAAVSVTLELAGVSNHRDLMELDAVKGVIKTIALTPSFITRCLILELLFVDLTGVLSSQSLELCHIHASLSQLTWTACLPRSNTITKMEKRRL